MASPSRLHKRTVLSYDPVAMVLPSGEKATLVTAAVWPYSGMRGIRHRLVHTPRTQCMAGPCAGAPPRSCSTPRHPPAPQHTATPTPLPPPTAAPDTSDGIFSRPPTKGPPRRWSSVSHHLFTQARYGQFLGEEVAANGAWVKPAHFGGQFEHAAGRHDPNFGELTSKLSLIVCLVSRHQTP